MRSGARPPIYIGSPSPADTEREARWACGLLPQLGGVALQGLLETFGSISRAWTASPDALQQVTGIGPVIAAAMRRFPWARMVRQDQARVADAGLTVLVWGDAEYPARLHAIRSAPPVLYIRGHSSRTTTRRWRSSDPAARPPTARRWPGSWDGNSAGAA